MTRRLSMRNGRTLCGKARISLRNRVGERVRRNERVHELLHQSWSLSKGMILSRVVRM
jgi:hypothetical protein